MPHTSLDVTPTSHRHRQCWRFPVPARNLSGTRPFSRVDTMCAICTSMLLAGMGEFWREGLDIQCGDATLDVDVSVNYVRRCLSIL